MIGKNFHVAMANTLRIASYESPGTIQRKMGEWLIVTRTDDQLLIHDAGGLDLDNIPDEAPERLIPNNTIVGQFIRTDSDDTDYFILIRALRPKDTIPEMFFPVDGFAKVTVYEENIFLKASGRHSHIRGNMDGDAVPFDMLAPLPRAQRRLAWHFDACSVPWSQERLPVSGRRNQ
jgi:hypothetical protein